MFLPECNIVRFLVVVHLYNVHTFNHLNFTIYAPMMFIDLTYNLTRIQVWKIPVHVEQIEMTFHSLQLLYEANMSVIFPDCSFKYIL